MNWQNVMVDLETMGKGPTAAIVAIGAVAFDVERGLGPELYQPVRLASSVADGGVMDPETVGWWLQQDEKARAVFTDDRMVSIGTALDLLHSFLVDELGGGEDLYIWGNGAAFDNVILRSAEYAAGYQWYWSYKNDRCYRTLRALFPDVEFEPCGIHHNALDDAKAQAAHAVRLLARLKGCSQ